MGVPTDATVATAEAFSGLSIFMETRWGLTSSITPNKNFIQGSVSGSEQAKPAQSQILALRAVSKAFYLTFKGRKVHAAGFVDDTEHYGKGALDLASILRELSLGSIATGIGYAWPKFIAFASDWDKAVDVVGHPFTPSGIHASGWDIWNGGTLTAVVPKAKMDTIEELLGKIGTIQDRHSLAAANTISKVRAVRIRASAIRASWDELATMWQLIARGIIGYAPLVGTPSPSSLHAEDNAFALAILAGLGTRASVERSSLTAPRSVGGLQLASVVECAVGSVSSELMFLLNGGTLASDLVRDALQEAMLSDPLTTDFSDGLVLKAMRFLSGYGIYLTVATDKLVGRMLDNYAARHKVRGHSLIVPFNAQAFAKAQKLCRVGAVASTISLAINALLSATNMLCASGTTHLMAVIIAESSAICTLLSSYPYLWGRREATGRSE